MEAGVRPESTTLVAAAPGGTVRCWTVFAYETIEFWLHARLSVNATNVIRLCEYHEQRQCLVVIAVRCASRVSCPSRENRLALGRDLEFRHESNALLRVGDPSDL